MLKDLYTNTLPSNLTDEKLDFSLHEWDLLMYLWNKNFPDSSIKFSYENTPDPVWKISEVSSPIDFQITRSRVNYSRKTLSDSCGLLGLSLINPQDPRVILTEGVSDFFTAKLLCPSSNVLGITSLGASPRARSILLSLFTKVLYCSDNDSAGLNASQSLRSLFQSFNVSFSSFLPPSPHKDLSESFIFNLKLAQSNV